jgi:GMP synthase (glutamine-hydrolysing)
LAATALEPNAAIRFGQRMWGVQFHPEMDAEIIGHYLEARRSDIEAEGLDVEQILTARVESSYGSRLLRRFAAYCGELLEERSVAQESKS